MPFLQMQNDVIEGDAEDFGDHHLHRFAGAMTGWSRGRFIVRFSRSPRGRRGRPWILR